MAKSTTKSATLTIKASISECTKPAADEVIIKLRDEEGNELGFSTVTRWFSDRKGMLLARLIKDTGNAQVDSFEIVDSAEAKGEAPALKTIKGVVKKLAKIAKVKAEKKSRKVKDASGIEKDAGTESDLISKYGDKIIPGTLRFETEGKYAGKRTVEIRCLKLLVAEEDGSGYDWADNEYTDQTRRVATSDLFQVHGTEADHHEKRKADRRLAHKLRASGLK